MYARIAVPLEVREAMQWRVHAATCKKADCLGVTRASCYTLASPADWHRSAGCSRLLTALRQRVRDQEEERERQRAPRGLVPQGDVDSNAHTAPQ